MDYLRGSAYVKRILLLLPLAFIGIIVQLLNARHGAGVSPDSTYYLAAAQNFLSGQGLQILGPDGGFVPLTLWPPLFPIILAVFGRLGIEVYEAARVWNALMLGANVLLVGLIVARITIPSRIAPVVGSMLMLISVDIVSVHAWVWSDPTTMFFGFLGFLLIDHFLVEKKFVFLVTSAICCGLALITRYAAIPFMAVGIIALLLFQRGERLIKRFLLSITYAVLSLAPLIFWIIRNQSLTGNSIGRAIGFDAEQLRRLEVGLAVVSDWILPGRISGEIRGWIGLLFLLGWLAAAVIYGIVKSKDEYKSKHHAPLTYLPQLIVFFFLLYSSMLLLGMTLFKPGFPLNNRILTLLYVAIVIGSIGIAHEVFHGIQLRVLNSGTCEKKMWKTSILVFIILIIGWVGFQLVHTGKWTQGAYNKGLGYASRSWRDSSEIKYIKDLPVDALIYSNGPDAIYFLTDRRTKLLPGNVQDVYTLSYVERSSIDNMKDDLLRQGGYIVYFRGITWRDTLKENELHQLMNLEPIFGTESGSIFTLEEVGQ